ncbi:MAG: hypothetical protein WAW88_17900 [Nocardioides sp.]
MRRPPPALALFVLAPFVAEVLTTSTPIGTFVLPWTLLFEGTLYGGGALLVREFLHASRTRASGGGLAALVVLGAAYGIFEEALLVRSWFAPDFLAEHQDYSRVWQTSILQAVHLTLFHATVSIGVSIAVVELLYPSHRDRPWAGPRLRRLAWMGLGGLALFTLAVPGAFFPVAWPQVLTGYALVAVLIWLAPRLPGGWPQPTRPGRRWWRLAAELFVWFTAHFVIVWSAPGLQIPWPAAVLLSLVPAVIAWRRVPRLLPERPVEQWLGCIVGLTAPLLLVLVLVGAGGAWGQLAVAALGIGLLVWLARAARAQVQPAAGRST